MPTVTRKMQVVFTERVNVNGQGIDFTDALYLTPEEDATISEEDMADMMNERINAFIDRLQNPPEVPEPTDADLQQQIDDLQTQIDSLTDQQTQVQTTLDTKVERRLGKQAEGLK